jgi:hypothetical protein
MIGGAADAQGVGRLGTVVGKLLLAVCQARSELPVVPVPVVPAPVVPVWYECWWCGLPVVLSVVRAPVVRRARYAECRSLLGVVPISAGCAGCGGVRTVVQLSGWSCRCGTMEVWSAHAARKRLKASSRPTRPCSGRALREEIAAILECDLVPRVVPISTARR